MSSEFAAPLRACESWPGLPELQKLVSARGVANASGAKLRLVRPSPARGRSYEARVYPDAELEVRERDWHDLLNVIVWLAYPRAKAALNARHVVAAAAETSGRGAVRDALTLLDESGMIVLAARDDLLQHVRDFRWKTLFWHEREAVRESMRFLGFGHALLQKVLRPYVGLTAHAVLFDATPIELNAPAARQLEAVDERLAAALADPARFKSARTLSPLPVLGVPGWWPPNEHEAFYDDAMYFRPGRQRA
jgi:hypothetical protein